MAFKAFCTLLLLLVAYSQALPIRDDKSTELALTEAPTAPATTAIDTLGEEGGRVKRQGGCGCGCGCCCCRPRCCCCCRRCCTCCRTCCCTCCRPCCCCCRPCCGCCGGCGCCGCGGGGRKRRSLQVLKIKLADQIERQNRQAALAITGEEAQLPEVGVTSAVVVPEEEPTTTEWPAPVYELVTETSA
ncbi:unnamed protein product [Caenorhabditis auriculariae]|uniref:Uncharacterized protein n=1 Tax=Caenorhabditis auriculariae TaxID=2777116 RepID=A0A8S1H003_9PELO|nr:unnamed protein product [Caenorhabditis auriculariae]